MAESEESEEEVYKCPICKDKKVVIYRVHEDTVWNKVEGYQYLVPESMVLEEDFLAGKICKPEEAYKWRKTYSRICECVEKDKTNKLLKSSEITEQFKQLGFKNFITANKPEAIIDAYECAMEYYQEYGKIKDKRQNSIALLGQPGAGKTHLLTAIANNLIVKRKVPVLYFPYVEGFNDLKDDFDKLEDKLERMKNIQVLFIDDLFKPVNGKPRATDWQIEQTYSVINYRYLNNKPILISSELSVDELVKVDEALGTRIFQMCQDYLVVIEGDRRILNFRLAGA